MEKCKKNGPHSVISIMKGNMAGGGAVGSSGVACGSRRRPLSQPWKSPLNPNPKELWEVEVGRERAQGKARGIPSPK